MVRLRQLPFFKLAIVWILGILCYQEVFQRGQWVLITLFSTSFLLLLADRLKLIKSLQYVLKIRSVAVLVCLFCTSWLFNSITDPIRNPNHIVNQDEYDYLILELQQIHYKAGKTHKVTASISSGLLNGQKKALDGKLICYNSDSVLNHARVGDYWMVAASSIKTIPQPTNPKQFNYARYMGNKGIYHQAFLRTYDAHIVRKAHGNIVFEFLRNMRLRVAQSLNYLPQQERSLAQALLVGVKDDLSADTKRDFSRTGAMHVLAVSGLHVGIIYWILNKALLFLIGFKFGRHLRLVLLLMGLWAYALLTGFPPSVQRATIMFSVIVIGSQLKRPTNTLNTVLLTAFAMLTYKPSLLTDVGFQLSYSAVLGIIVLQPAISMWLKPRGLLLKFLWDILSVSIAAQCATLPITLYYFHQFPVWFLLSNIVAIPAAFLVVSGGVVLQVITFFGGQLLSIYQLAYEHLLSSFLWAISGIANLPWSHIHHISIDLLDVVLLVIVLFFLANSLLKKRLKYTQWGLLVLILQQGLHLVQRQYILPKQEFVVFDAYRNSLYGLKLPNRSVLFLHSSDSTDHGFSTSGFFENRVHVDSLTIDVFPTQEEHSFFNQHSLFLPGHRIHLVGDYLPNLNFFDHFIIHKHTPHQLIKELLPEKCVFDSGIHHGWFLAKYPNFAAAHFVSRDGAFLIQTK